MSTFSAENLHPGLSIDCVIFGFHANTIKILLLKLKSMDKCSLPGGFVFHKEDVDKAAVRVLKERTGLDNIFLKQFHFFGDVARNETPHIDSLIKEGVLSEESAKWFNQRFNSIGYYALVEYSKVKAPKADMLSDICEWRDLDDCPELMLDHKQIARKAYSTLKSHLNYQPIGRNLLPEHFTIPELQGLYETLLNRKLDRRNFRRKMLALDILVDTGKQRRTGQANKAPSLYMFDEKKYNLALNDGLFFI